MKEKDLKIREKLLAIRGYNSIVTFMLRMEKDGDYQPLHSLNFYKQYTKKSVKRRKQLGKASYKQHLQDQENE